MTATTNVLTLPSLVLNRHWIPVHQTTVREALCLLAKGGALAVSADYQLHRLEDWTQLRAIEGAPLVRTVRLAFQAPLVVRLIAYDRVPAGRVVFSRRNLFCRDRWSCQYCGRQARGDELTIDHVLPRSRGGVSSWENCVLACVECNKRKADRTPDEAGLRLRRPPVRPRVRPVVSIPVGRIYERWKDFVSRAYWDVELDA